MSAILHRAHGIKRSSLQRIAIIAGAEILLRKRSRSTVYHLLALIALAAAFIPRPGAGYAIISTDSGWLKLVPDTAMLAISAVLSIFLLLIFPLFLNFGIARDRASGVTGLLRSLGLPAGSFGLGRGLGLYGFAALFAAACWTLLYATLWLRFGSVPGARAIAASAALLSLPVAVSVPVAVLLESFVGSAILRAVLAFAWWTGCIIVSIGGPLDISGFRLVRAALPPGVGEGSVSIGLVSTTGAAARTWQTIEPAALTAASHQFAFAAIACLLGLSIAALMGPFALKTEGREPAKPRSFAIPEPRPQQCDRPIQRQTGVPPPTLVHGALLEAERLLRRSPGAGLVALVACAAGLAAPAIGLILTHLAAILLMRKISLAESRLASAFEPSLAVFCGSNSVIAHIAALAVPMLVAAGPSLLSIPPLQALTAAAGLVSSAIWLVWTHRHLASPILGVAVLGGLIYLTGFNDVPRPFAVFGFSESSVAALGGQLVMLTCLALLVARAVPRSPRK
ncbi:hypothetical protein [Qipengyuania profunda]|jgi:hypothetical protein|uniref:hypothetical protein n=1 Tax=Qipengyuania profunda TaxID=3113984 RepID=UPI002A18A503|nr:hypothetical protein [Qipengyuania sp. HL-TH1]WPL57901.1 hypothetical protein SD421_05565 [Qipengyuania sp. HL-TH5]